QVRNGRHGMGASHRDRRADRGLARPRPDRRGALPGHQGRRSALAVRRAQGQAAPCGTRTGGMSAAIATILGIAVSTTGIALLALNNPKRRRSFGLPGRRSRAAMLLGAALVAAPPVLLLARAEAAPVVMWLGAVTVAGWAVAMRRPN